MSDAYHQDLCRKIAGLVEERGWNQETFARICQLNRLTVRKILKGTAHNLHNATVAACAQALGVSVHDLREQSLEELLPRLSPPRLASSRERAADVGAAFEETLQPELAEWAEAHPAEAAQLTASDWDELRSLQGTGGPLTAEGVEHYVGLLQRKRALAQKVAVIAGTEQLGLLEEFVDFLYQKIQPYHQRQLPERHDSE